MTRGVAIPGKFTHRLTPAASKLASRLGVCLKAMHDLREFIYRAEELAIYPWSDKLTVRRDVRHHDDLARKEPLCYRVGPPLSRRSAQQIASAAHIARNFVRSYRPYKFYPLSHP